MSARTEPKPWDRVSGESAKAYKYFTVYLKMPPEERSLGRVGVEVGRSTTNIENFSGKWCWVERVDAWDRHQDALNFERFERMRATAARRRIERELARQEEAEQVSDLLVERARTMLTWPIQEEESSESTQVTEDGQKLTVIRRVIKPAKWDLNTAVRFVDALDRMRRSSVVDATSAEAPRGVTEDQIGERSFTLFTPEQVQLPKPPEEAVTTEPKPQDDWTATYGEAAAKPTDQAVRY